ncbi:hypothetical protein [Laceyella putida]|jgi:hypothetical protein|uniref:Uncharacterized protein n=1 Tax=Laceyella putida TaxID=110101 RepID=A0ABW2RJH9_9BACL
MNHWFKESKTDIQPKHPKSNWATGPEGKYDGKMGKGYSEAKADNFLKESRKNPWDK